MSSGWRRQRTSGLRRKLPSPEQGTSASTRSKAPARHAGAVPSATTTRGIELGPLTAGGVASPAGRTDGIHDTAERGTEAIERGTDEFGAVPVHVGGE